MKRIINLIGSINYNPKIIAGLLITWIIGYNLATFDYINFLREYRLEQARADKQDLKAEASKQTEELKQTLEALNKTNKCIEANSKTGSLVDCNSIKIKEVEVSVENTDWTTLPSKAYDKELKIEEWKKEEFRWTILPKDLFYTTKLSDKCWVSQTEQQHFTRAGGYMLATDVACNFDWWKSDKAEVYAPDYLDKSITYISLRKKDELLWDYIELYFSDNTEEDYNKKWWIWLNKKWVLWHTTTKLKTWDVIHTGERLGQMNLSWYTTGYHTHIELWSIIDWKWKNISYTTRSEVLNNKRNNVLQSWKNWDTIYLTSYHLWDVNQNDEAPYIWRSGKDLRNVKNPIALTIDVRKSLRIKFGDKVKLSWPCSWIYQVEDEMNQRFRYSCIKKDWVCIKWDIALNLWEEAKCSWKYTITKI